MPAGNMNHFTAEQQFDNGMEDGMQANTDLAGAMYEQTPHSVAPGEGGRTTSAGGLGSGSNMSSGGGTRADAATAAFEQSYAAESSNADEPVSEKTLIGSGSLASKMSDEKRQKERAREDSMIV